MSQIKHKWHKELCAWANGEDIEYTYIGYEHYWEPMYKVNEDWNDDAVSWQNQSTLFRIKPNTKEKVNETVYPQSVL